MIKSFAPLKIKFTLEDGYTMDYKIVEKDSFVVIGASRMFNYDTAKSEIPQFCTERYQTGKGKNICGMYGLCIDESAGSDEFEYLIADNYDPSAVVPDDFVTKTIPKHTWAVFACKGAMPKALEWLPNCKDYEIAAGYNVEMYTALSDYPKGNQDENYYSEIWIPFIKK